MNCIALSILVYFISVTRSLKSENMRLKSLRKEMSFEARMIKKQVDSIKGWGLSLSQAKSAACPPWDGKWVVAYGLRVEGVSRLIGAVVCPCLLAANRRCSLVHAMDGRIVRCGIISLCQSAATFEIVRALLTTSSSHVRSAMASTGL